MAGSGGISCNDDLTRKPSEAMKTKIAETLFGKDVCKERRTEADRYFQYYEKELALMKMGKLSREHSRIVLQTHQDVLDVVKDLRQNGTRTKRELCSDLGQRFADNDEASQNRSLDLVVRLWVMLNVREPSARLRTTQTRVLLWSEDQSFQDFATAAFPASRWSLDARDSRLHPSFTASFMTDVCGLQLEWTDCMADHLRLDRRRKVLRVFSYKSLIEAHLQMLRKQPTGRSNCPFNEEMLVETLWTLNILFPHWDHATNDLLQSHGQTFQQAGPFDVPPTLNLVEFIYWRDRMFELHDVVFLSPPVSWAQLWRDRRNPQQFWTFWIALVILGLTLVSTVASIVQSWASVKALSQH